MGDIKIQGGFNVGANVEDLIIDFFNNCKDCKEKVEEYKRSLVQTGGSHFNNGMTVDLKPVIDGVITTNNLIEHIKTKLHEMSEEKKRIEEKQEQEQKFTSDERITMEMSNLYIPLNPNILAVWIMAFINDAVDNKFIPEYNLSFLS